MNAKRNQLAYQEAAVRNASAIDLVVMLYDILASDLSGAIEAIEAGNVELRGAKLKHGFLVLQQLEGTLNMEEGGDLAANMSRFYSMLRGQMMKAQIQQDAAVLREVIQLLFSVREAWVELSNRLTTSSESAVAKVSSPAPGPAQDSEQVQTASWKA
jgi:flagellar secretion chaperone FliS